MSGIFVIGSHGVPYIYKQELRPHPNTLSIVLSEGTHLSIIESKEHCDIIRSHTGAITGMEAIRKRYFPVFHNLEFDTNGDVIAIGKQNRRILEIPTGSGKPP